MFEHYAPRKWGYRAQITLRAGPEAARMGTKAKLSVTHLADLNFSLSVLAVTSRKIEPRSDAPASEMQKAGDRPPYGQRRKLPPRPPKGRSFLYF